MRIEQPRIRTSNVVEVWKEEWSRRDFRLQFSAAVPALLLTLHFFTGFLQWVEQREGVTLNDPILAMIPPRDFTWLTFGIIYLAIVIALAYMSRHPRQLLLAIQSYTLIVIVRAVMMCLVPLNAPEGLIVLRDPLVQFVGNGAAPTKDLFFSGHTSTMFLFSLVMKRRALKNVYLVFTVLVATFVIWQHVHYVIDVAVAPFVAYGCYRSVAGLSKKLLVEKLSIHT